MKEPILLTPGPTLVPPLVRRKLGEPMVHHRTPEFQAVLKEAGEGLQKLFGTGQEVLILTCSGTGAMEAAVTNLLSPGDLGLVIRGGKFGERWGEICEAFGIDQVTLDPEWGQPLDLEALGKLVQQNSKIKAVFATLCETSTGVVYPIQEIRKAIGPEPLLVVDAISGLGADAYQMDAWGVDGTVCGSQKGLMLPPGLAMIALSSRAWEAAQNLKTGSFYFNLKAARKAWEKTDTPFTPGINLIVGLKEALGVILGEGLDKSVARHRTHAQAIRKAVTAMGLKTFVHPDCASNAVTSVEVPEGIDAKALLKKLREQGLFLAGGQGKLSGKIIRIGSMGAVGEKEIKLALNALEAVLGEMGFKGAVAGEAEKALEAALS